MNNIKIILGVILMSYSQFTLANNDCEVDAEVENTRIEDGYGWSKFHLRINASHDAPLSHSNDTATVSGTYTVEYESDEDGNVHQAFSKFSHVFKN